MAIKKLSKTEKKHAYDKKLCQLLDEYSKVLVAQADNVGSTQLAAVRRGIRGESVMLMGKNTLIRRCIKAHADRTGNENIKAIIPLLKGNVGLIFTQGDLKEVCEEVAKYKVGAPARVGLIAPIDVVVPPGNTGLDPSQTSFFQVLNIPTKINKGTVEIIAHVDLIKKGDKVGSSEAALLSKLCIRPFSYGLVITKVYDNGSVFSPEVLDLTGEDLMEKFASGVSMVASLSLAVSYPTMAAAPHMFLNGYKNVLAVAMATDYSYPRADQIKEYLKARDWTRLELDVLLYILQKLDHVEILMGPGQVCGSWRRATRDEPSLWRCINITSHDNYEFLETRFGMAQAAIRRAKGQCEAFCVTLAANDDVLKFLSHEAPSLKSLRLISCPRILEFEEWIKKFPCLEELELSFVDIGRPALLKKIGEVCPELKHFKLNAVHFFDVREGSADRYERDADAEGIASMSGLRSLQMFGNNLSNVGLTHILDHCPHLEYLDIRNCYNISLNEESLVSKLEGIKTVKMPYDSTEDYDYDHGSPTFSDGSFCFQCMTVH